MLFDVFQLLLLALGNIKLVSLLFWGWNCQVQLKRTKQLAKPINNMTREAKGHRIAKRIGEKGPKMQFSNAIHLRMMHVFFLSFRCHKVCDRVNVVEYNDPITGQQTTQKKNPRLFWKLFLLISGCGPFMARTGYLDCKLLACNSGITIRFQVHQM